MNYVFYLRKFGYLCLVVCPLFVASVAAMAEAKPQLPWGVRILVDEDLLTYNSFLLKIKARSATPIVNGTLTMQIPKIGPLEKEKVVFWEGNLDVPDLFEFDQFISGLEIGKYLFKASFEFRPSINKKKKIKLEKKLYVIVSEEGLFHSTVSFNYTEKLELKKQLEDRELLNVSDKDLKLKALDLYNKKKRLHGSLHGSATGTLKPIKHCCLIVLNEL